MQRPAAAPEGRAGTLFGGLDVEDRAGLPGLQVRVVPRADTEGEDALVQTIEVDGDRRAVGLPGRDQRISRWGRRAGFAIRGDRRAVEQDDAGFVCRDGDATVLVVEGREHGVTQFSYVPDAGHRVIIELSGVEHHLGQSGRGPPRTNCVRRV